MSSATRRPYHHGNLRAALLERAEARLSAGGAGELSLRDLAREVGVSHGAPRRHFPDKQALLDALAQEGFERLGRELGKAVGGPGAPGGPLGTRLAALARAYVRFATRSAALLELMFAGKHRPDATGALREAGERAFAAPLALIAEGQTAGEVTPGDPERVAVVVWACLHGLAALANARMLGEPELDDVVADAVERLVLGLRPR